MTSPCRSGQSTSGFRREVSACVALAQCAIPLVCAHPAPRSGSTTARSCVSPLLECAAESGRLAGSGAAAGCPGESTAAVPRSFANSLLRLRQRAAHDRLPLRAHRPSHQSPRRLLSAAQAVMSGEGLPLVGRLLGHDRHRTTAGYAHLADAHLVEAVEKVGAIIATAMASQRPRPITHRQ